MIAFLRPYPEVISEFERRTGERLTHNEVHATLTKALQKIRSKIIRDYASRQVKQ